MAPKAKAGTAKARGASAGAKAKAKGKAKAKVLGAPVNPSQEPEVVAVAAIADPVAAQEPEPAVASTPAPPLPPVPVPVPAHASEPATPARPSVAERAAQLASLSDPWAGVPDADAMQRVKEEAWAEASVDDAVADGAVHVNAKDGGHCDGFAVSNDLVGAAVSLDASENGLQRADVLPALWIRNLLLGGNPFQSLDGLGQLFPRLMALDLSFVEFPSVDGIWSALAHCQHLHSLVAEGASISSFEDMEPLLALKNLEVVENEVSDVDDLEALGERCPLLARLDMRENPVCTEKGYFKAAAKFMPKLVWHDAQTQRQGKVAGLGHLTGVTGLNKDVNAVDGLYKNESCSCLEGNPCIDPATCVDWQNREAVAAAARKKKGLRDETGKQL